MQVIHEAGSRPIKAWVGTRQEVIAVTDDPRGTGTINATVPDIEDAALSQLKNIARLPFIAPNGLAVLPDVHLGKGATVGSVIATDKAVIPAAVGVDIGCGMNAVRLSLKASDLPESLTAIRHQIERDVPLGNNRHGSKYVPPGHDCQGVHPLWGGLHQGVVPHLSPGNPERLMEKAWFQLGSLGSGNHFIELCIDENEDVWIMLHSGSRGIGNMIGSYFIEKAKKNMEKFFINLPDKDLAYLPEDTDDFKAYVAAVEWAQNYALENRRIMMEVVIAALRRHIAKEFTLTSEAVNCHHNYISRENHFGRNLWVTRKGAIRARDGELGIIPGSMGQRSYIVRGKGNPESYCSCSHGAGRAMSRAEAKRRFSLKDLVEQTAGVECRKDLEVIDEIPGSYKPLDVVMANQKDLIEVVHTLKAVLCVKGN